MLLTPEQLLEIGKIIEKYHSAFIVNAISPEAVAKDILRQLKDSGLVDPKPKVESIKDAYLYGQLLGILENKTVANMSFEEFKKYIAKNPIPLTTVERQAIQFTALNAAQYCKGLGNRVILQTGDILVEADQALRAQMETTIKNKTMQNIAARKSIKALKSDLGWATKDWARDWDRIAITEKQNAMQRGLADNYRKGHGEDALVAKRPMPDACKYCKDLHIGTDGQPRIFKLSTLEANGTNVGRKAADWKAVVGTVHPHCQCQMIRIPKGWGFDEEGDLVPGGKFGEKYESAEEIERALKDEMDLQKSFQLQDHIVFQGIPIAIENTKDSVRTWKDADGNTGETTLTYAYGYVKRTMGADGDEIDCFVGPNPRAENVFLIHQQDPSTGTYDEEKAMIGFGNQWDAERAYRENYDVPDKFFLTTSPMTLEAFERWVSMTKPKKGETLAKSGNQLAHVVPLKKSDLNPFYGAATSPAGNRAPGPGLGVNFYIPQGKRKLKDYKHRKAQQQIKPEDLEAEDTGVHKGDPLKKKKSDYDFGQKVPVVPRPVEIPKEWAEYSKQARAGAKERKERFILQYHDRNVGEPSKPLVKAEQQVVAIGEKGGQIVGYDSKGKPIYKGKAAQLAKKHGGKIVPGYEPGTVSIKIPKEKKQKLIDFQQEHNLPAKFVEGGKYFMLIASKEFVEHVTKPKLVAVTKPTLKFAKAKQKRTSDLKVIKNLDDLKVPKVDPNHMFRGQEITVKTKSGIVEAKLEGTDQVGTPVVNLKGKDQLVPWNKIRAKGDKPKPYESTLKSLPAGAVVKPTKRQSKLMQQTVNGVNVCMGHVGQEYTDWLWQRGQESFVVGGLVRDLLQGTHPDTDMPDEDILELMMDVDIVTPADPLKVEQCLKAIGPETMPYYNDNGTPWGVLRLVGNGSGLDVASVTQDGTFRDAEVWNEKLKRTVPKVKLDHDLIADCERRDFTCNAVYYDPNNDVFVDPTGQGIADAQNKVLRLTTDEKTAKQNKTLGYRYFKFRMRGYSPTEETHKFCTEQFADYLASASPKTKAKDLYRFFVSKGGSPALYLEKLRKVMKSDGLEHVWKKHMEPQVDQIISLINYYSEG